MESGIEGRPPSTASLWSQAVVSPVAWLEALCLAPPLLTSVNALCCQPVNDPTSLTAPFLWLLQLR